MEELRKTICQSNKTSIDKIWRAVIPQKLPFSNDTKMNHIIPKTFFAHSLIYQLLNLFFAGIQTQTAYPFLCVSVPFYQSYFVIYFIWQLFVHWYPVTILGTALITPTICLMIVGHGQSNIWAMPYAQSNFHANP